MVGRPRFCAKIASGNSAPTGTAGFRSFAAGRPIAVILFLLLISIPARSERIASKIGQGEIPSTAVRLPVVDGLDIRFYRLSTREGLSQGRVAQIVQDDLGFMWFGTQYGLNRYDGYKFKTFKHEPGNPSSLSGVYIYSLFKDRAGTLWIGCDQYLDRFDPVTESFTHYRVHVKGASGSGATVVQISQDHGGILWLATAAGLFKFDSVTGQMSLYHHSLNDSDSLASNDVKSTGEDRLGTFWVVTKEGLDAFDPKTGKVTSHIPLYEPRESAFYEDRFGYFWIFHRSGTGLALVDRKTKKVSPYLFYDREPSHGSVSGVSAMFEDRKGTLWLATQGSGLLKFDRERGRFIRYRSHPDNPDSLAENRLVSLYEDRDGNIWIGQSGSGLNIFSTRHLPIEKLPRGPGNIQITGDNLVGTIHQNRDGSLWLGTPGGLNSLNQDGASYNFVRTALPGVNVISTAEGKSDVLWAGTFGEGLKRFNTRTGHVDTYRHNDADPHSLSNDIVPGLLIDRTGALWAATWDGLDRFEPATGQFAVYKLDPISQPQLYLSIGEDSKGLLWLGTHFSGLQRFDPATDRFTVFESNPNNTNSVSDSRVNSVFFDHSDVMWVGTQNGMDRFNRKTGKSVAYSERDGLAGDTVSCILEDAKENLWIGTNKGLSRFDSTRRLFSNYSVADGLPGDDLTGWTACFKNQSGKMFFGGRSGAIAFNPEEVGASHEVPPTVLTEFRLSGIPMGVRPGSPLKKAITYSSDLVLSSRQNIFSFEFSALNYTDPAANRYRYMLVGLDTQWNQVSADRRLASYTTLPSGDYILRVQGATGRGTWSEPGLALKIKLLPPWWKTWWFRTIYVIAGFFLLWSAYRYRLSQLAHEFAARLDERVGERTRIARELHDTLLQSFHGLMLRFQAVYTVLPEHPVEAKKSLKIAIDRAAEAITESRDAVQELRHNKMGNSDLVKALTSLGEELRTDQGTNDVGGVSATFRVLVEGTPRRLQATLRDDLYGIAREAVGNAFHHARASQVEVDIRFDRRMLRLRVRDNGVGMDPTFLARGGREGHWGLPGMRERAKSISGQLELWSELGRGTEVEVTIPGIIAYGRHEGADNIARF